MSPLRTFGIFAAALTLAGCQPRAEPAEPEPVAATDATIASAVATANEGAIDVARMASERASDPDVRAYADKLLEEHTRAGEEFRDMLEDEGITPRRGPLADELEAQNRGTVEHLRNLSGMAFDRTFLDHGIETHERLLETFDITLIPGADDDDLRQSLQTIRDALQQHLDEARRLRNTL